MKRKKKATDRFLALLLTAAMAFTSAAAYPVLDVRAAETPEALTTAEPAAVEPETEPAAEEPQTEAAAEEPETEPAAEEPQTENTADNAAEQTSEEELTAQEETRIVSHTGYGADGTNEQVTWTIYTNGDLEVTGEGEIIGSSNQAPWSEYRNEIINAKVTVSNATKAQYMFSGCTALQAVDLSGFSTEAVTDMSYMFADCTSLVKLDLSSFVIGASANVGSMLSGCTGLKEIVNPFGIASGMNIRLPETDGTCSWRIMPDGTKTTFLCEQLDKAAGAVTLSTNQKFGISLHNDEGGSFTLAEEKYKDISFINADLPRELEVVDSGANTSFAFTIVPQDGWVVESVTPYDGTDSGIRLTKGGQPDSYIVTPLDENKGYFRDVTIGVRVTTKADYTLNLTVGDNVEDVIVANGDSWTENKPSSVSVSNQYDTTVYVKTADGGQSTFIPKLEQTFPLSEKIQCETDTGSLSEKEKEYVQKGYAVFRLGRINTLTNISISAATAYRLKFTAEELPGEVRIYSYTVNEYSGQAQQGMEFPVGGEVTVERGKFYIRVDWTPDAANRYCSPQVTFKDEEGQENIQQPVTLSGLDGDVWEINPERNMEVKVSLKPHTIELANLDMSNFSDFDITIDGGHVDCYQAWDNDAGILKWYVDVRSGDSFALKFKLLDGVSSSWAWNEELTCEVGQDGAYTITVNDMSKIRNIPRIDLQTEDSYGRVSLSDANCKVFVKFQSADKTGIPVYTGEPIEASGVAVTAQYDAYGNGKPKVFKLAQGRDYELQYQDNINAGIARMIFTMIPDSRFAQYFKGSYEYPFEIRKAAAPDEQEKTVQVENLPGQLTFREDLLELFRIDTPIEKGVKPVEFRMQSCEKGGVLSADAGPVLEGNILTYTIREDANKYSDVAKVGIYASFTNYESCSLTLTIQVVKKETLVLGGIVKVEDKTYDGREVLPDTAGLKVVSKEGTALNEQEAADILNRIKDTLSCHYSGAEGTQYDSDETPVDIGTYKVWVKIADENLDYKSAYLEGGTFKITSRPATVAADDVKLYQDDSIPVQYGYHTDGLADGDAVSSRSFISCAIQNTAQLAEYPITVNASAVKISNSAGRDVTANYTITGKEGRLSVLKPEPGSYTVIYMGLDPLNPETKLKRSGNEAGKLLEKPIDPIAEGYVFLGWFTDETAAREWDFAADIIQSDITLYAGWSKGVSESGGMALCVQEIMRQSYTGAAVKPMVTVYAADGKTRLKLKKDYTVTYRNNVNASEEEGGIGESLNDTSQGFNSALPYVIIQGKGNYKGTVYVNFRISKADISAAEEAGSGFALKYTDQFEEKPGKYAAVVTQFKYKKKSLGYNKDYTLEVKKLDGADSESGQAAVALNARGQLPLAGGQYRLTISGKGNFTGEITKTLYVADKTMLFKNAKVTCKGTVSDVTKEQLEAGIQPENLVVKMNNNVLTKDVHYTVECTGNHAAGTATVTVKPAASSGYIGSKSITFKIKGTAFKANAVQISGWQDAVTYTGRAMTQNGVVLKAVDGRELAYGVDYTVSYRNNIKKGTATAVFTANPSSGYSGSFNKKFRIMPMDLGKAVDGAEILLAGAEKTEMGWKLPEGVPYQKSGVMPADKVTLQLASTGSILTAGKGRDYTVAYKNNKAVSDNTAYMTLKGTGNFTGSITVYFDITKASLSRLYQEGRVTITSASVKVPYPHERYWEDYGDGDGEWIEGDLKDPDREFRPAVTVKDGTKALKKDVDFTVEYSGNTRSELEGGNVLSVTITGIGDYGSDSETIELGITVNRTKLSAGKVTVVYENEFTYTGEQIMPEVTEVNYKVSNGHGREDDDDYEPPEWNTLTPGEDYRIEYTKNTAKGTGTIKIVGIGGYTGSVSKTFKINAREIYNSPGQPDEE